MSKTSRAVRGSSSGRPIMLLLDVLGRRWSLRIMWELRGGQRLTFRELQAACDNLSPTSLNRRLKELRELKLIDHTGQGFGHTPWGEELGEHLLTLNNWSETWHKSL